MSRARKERVADEDRFERFKALAASYGEYLPVVLVNMLRSPAFGIKSAGARPAASLLEGCLFWAGKSQLEGDWFWKYQDEWERRHGLTRDNLETGIRHLSKSPLLFKYRHGVGKRGEFWVDVEGWYSTIENYLAALKLSERGLRLVPDKNPIETAGNSPIPEPPNTPIQNGAFAQSRTVHSPIPSMYAVENARATTVDDSLSTRARAAADLPSLAPVQPAERENLIVDVFENGERESPANVLAEKLISLQAKMLTVSVKDRAAAFKLAAGAVERELPADLVLKTSAETILELSNKPGQITPGFSAAIFFIEKKLLRVRAALVQEAALARATAADAPRRAQAEQQQRERAEREAARQAEIETSRAQADNERAAAKSAQLAEISAGRVEVVDLFAELAAISKLARQSDSIEDLQAAFDWCATNRGAADPLGWSVVDARWLEFKFAGMKASLRTRPPTQAADRRATPRAAFTDPVGKTLIAVCGLDVEACSDSAYRDLQEAQSGYALLSRGLLVDGRVSELERFGEWFRLKASRAPAPMEIINRLSEFRSD